MPFEPNKNTKELGIDTSRKFRVVENNLYFKQGDIVVLDKDDNSDYPWFKKIGDNKPHPIDWKDLEYAEEPKEVIIHCPTEELFNKVQKHNFERGIYWRDGDKKIMDYWDEHKQETCISILEDSGYKMSWSNKQFYQKRRPNIPIISAEEYLGLNSQIIKELNGIKVGDRVRYKGYEGYVAVIDPYNNYLLRLEGFSEHRADCNWNNPWYPESEKKDEANCTWRGKEDFEIIEPEINKEESFMDILRNQSIQQIKAGMYPTFTNITTINKPKQKIMSKAINFIKNASLSSDEKLLREYGMKNEDGNYTDDLLYTVKELEAKDLGFKSYEKMCEQYNFGIGTGTSVFEAHTLVEKHLPKVLENLKELKKEDKKK